MLSVFLYIEEESPIITIVMDVIVPPSSTRNFPPSRQCTGKSTSSSTDLVPGRFPEERELDLCPDAFPLAFLSTFTC
ncbi:hypothetical protein ACFX2B_023331 [Malus domestica]